ncbi:M16 family metallopeptidase [Enterobacteriaceae bacterium LUAb1]
MQSTRMRLLVGGWLLTALSTTAQAEPLQPDPAWQQGKLDNGFNWQVLSTPQRPSDFIELRLLIDTGSLAEDTRQTGYSRLLPRVALVHNTKLAPARQRSLWQQSIDHSRTKAPAVTSYDYTMYNLSLPTNRPELLKEALDWLSATAGQMQIDKQTVNTAMQASDPVATWPVNPQDVWWRYRLKGSPLLVHNPADSPSMPVDIAALNAFYKQRYTPDNMTLFVVGNVDSRSLAEQINKAFSGLEGRRENPEMMPVLSPLPLQPVSLVNSELLQDRLSLVWDLPWKPIQESQQLLRYWQSDLAREALFWHVQRVLSDTKTQNIQVGFDCRVFYQRGQCAINMDTANMALESNMMMIARELVNVRDNGLSQAEFEALMAQKTVELDKLFATYARTDTEVLMNQRLRSQQNAVVDIAPEQYQQLRQQFLSHLTLPMLNQELLQQLSQEPTIVLMQPQNEAETNVFQLQEEWLKVMTPLPVTSSTVTAEDTKPGMSDLPLPQP